MIKVKKVFGVLLMATAAVLGTVAFPSVSLAASSFTDNLDSDNTSFWQKADGYSNGGVFGCTWRDSQIAFDKTMNITLNKDTKEANPKYAGGEYRSTKFYGYGLYEVNMKPAKNSGIVSSFFTYTGPSDKKPWDEIDIEFLGKDTTQFQANYYVNGVGNHEKMISLGFDASQSYHTYAFDWEPTYIAWYVDGVEKYRATGATLPTHQGKIMMNLWPGTGVDTWLGAYNGNEPLSASYDWVRYTPSDKTESSFSDNFDSYNADEWEKADGYSNGAPFDCTWWADQITVNQKMSITLQKDMHPRYMSGEYRTTNFYSYGKYEVNMKPAKNTGIISSFFTYTGPSDKNPWDEIDIEFLGKDTTQIQVNYYVNGVGKHEKMIPLGFDASESFHTYAFDWEPGYIAWYVDGVEKYRVTGGTLPSHDSKIMLNVWPGKGVEDWLGAYDGKGPLTASYDWVKYTKSEDIHTNTESSVIPGQIEAENYSSMNGIQTEECYDTNRGKNVGYIESGDYMDYNVNVKKAGTYTIDYRVASLNGGGQAKLQINGTDVANSEVNIGSTGNWQTYTTIGAKNVYLVAGKQTIRVYATTGGFNLNWIKFTEQVDQVYTIPGQIEAENYSNMSGIQTEDCYDTNGGKDTGYIESGDYMDYSVNVKKAGTYTIEYRVASLNGGGQAKLQMNGTDVANSEINIGSTGNWQTYTTVTAKNVYLKAGIQKIRVYATAGGFNVNWIKFAEQVTPTPTPTTTSLDWAFEDANSNGTWDYSTTWSGTGDSIAVTNNYGNLPTSKDYKYQGNSSIKFAFSHNNYYGYTGGAISTKPDSTGVEPDNDSNYNTGKNVSPYSYVKFYIMGDTNSKARIKFVDKSGNESQAIELTNYISVNSNWQQVKVPMSDIAWNSCDKSNLMQIKFLIDGCTYTQLGNWTFYIDNLQFTN